VFAYGDPVFSNRIPAHFDIAPGVDQAEHRGKDDTGNDGHGGKPRPPDRKGRHRPDSGK